METRPDNPAATVAGLPVQPPSFASGRYVVRRVLPEGGQKSVYVVHDSALDRECALALIKTDAMEPQELERFRREARAMARLDHPNVVTLYDIGEDGGRPFFVCQYIAGGDLRGALREAGGPLPIERTLKIAEDLCRALAFAHGHGIVHRDVKPANIWLTSEDTAKLGDFGLAVALGQSRVTQAGTIMGTAAYMPPEQALGGEVTSQSDLYSLGCVLYELLSGRPPFLGDDALAVISQHVNTAPVAPSWHNAQVPRPLEALILRLLAKAPADRPASAAAVLDELQRIPAAGVHAGAETVPAEPRRDLAGVEWGRFVGRHKEMDGLKDALEDALSGTGSLVMLVGEPGIGKTRLAEEFAVYAGLRGARVLSGRGYEGDSSLPYTPFIEALRQYTRSRPDDELRAQLGPGAPEIATLVSEIRQRFPDIEGAPKLDGEAERLRLFESATEFLHNAAIANPVVLFLDDLHWADKPSLLLLQHLAQRAAPDRFLILGAYRDVELDRTHPLSEVLGALRRLPNYRRVLLRGLPQESVIDLLTAIDPSEEGAAGRQALAAALYQETEGNPFFIREVMAHLIETGKIVHENGRWAGQVTSISELGIPEGVREVIGRRLTRLSEGCNRMLTLASTMAGGFSWEELKAICNEPEAEVLDLLEEALRAQLIAERKREGAGTYDFTHALIRQTLYEELSTPRRVLLHRQIGEALEQLYGASVERHLAELAHHFYQAAPGGDAEKATDYGRRAGDRAMTLFAWEEAAAHYQRALQVIELRPAPDECLRIDLLLALAEARLSEGGNDDSRRESALRAADIARQIGDRQRFARAVLSFAGPHREDGVLDPQLVALIEEALALIGREDSGLRAMLLVRLSIALWFTVDERQRTRSLSEEAVAMARRIGDKQALVYVLARGVWAWDAGNTEEQIANAKEMLALAAEAGNKSMALEAYTILVGPLLETGDRDGADAAIDAYIELQHEVRKPGWGMTWRAMQADLDGRLADVEPLATQGYAELQKVSENAGIAFGGQIMGLRRQQGRGMETERAMKDMLLDRLLVVRAALLGLTYAEAGRLDDAHAAFEEAAANDFAGVPFDRNWTLTMSFLADVCTLLRDVRRAGILYKLMRPYQDCCVVITTSCIALICTGSLHRPLGGLATTMSRWDGAERHYEAAIAMNQRMHSRGWLARTQSDYAAMLLARGGPGDDERARVLRDQALATAQEMGMKKVVEDCLALRLELQGEAGQDI